jgi:DNA primase
MNFSKDFPEKLKSSILISEVIGKKVKLKKHGKEFSGLCPFHNEKSPSFTVNDQKGFYHCFGCHAHGDIISFTIDSEALVFKDAVIKLANDFGIEIPYVKNLDNIIDYKSQDFTITEEINKFFEKNLYLPSNQNARTYLKNRGFNSVIAKKFHIGYAINSYEALIKHLQNLGFDNSHIENCGVVGKSDNGKLYDKLRNRITFAITDKKNRIIGFGGRSLGSDMPKYLNSAETELFKKNQTLYNFANAKKAIYDNGFAIIVEGYIDVISLAVNGFENVVAGLGTAISSNHIQQLFLITDKIIMCLDGDQAGINAAKRALEIALPFINSKKNMSFAFLPNQMDPDDFIKKSGNLEFKKILQDAIPLSQAMFDFANVDLGLTNKKLSAEDKARLEFELQHKINLITDNSVKKYFNLFVKESLFRLNSRNSSENNSIKFSKINNINAKHNPNIYPLSIIAYLIKDPTLVNYSDKEFDVREMAFEHQEITDLKEFVISLIDENCENIVEKLDKSDFRAYNLQIKNILDKRLINKNNIKQKFRILLLEDLLIKLEKQSKESLNIENLHNLEIINYKESIKTMINNLKNDI